MGNKPNNKAFVVLGYVVFCQLSASRILSLIIGLEAYSTGCYSKHSFSADEAGVIDVQPDGETPSPLVWRAVDSNVSPILRAISCPAQELCVIVGPQVALRSTDAGETWTSMELDNLDVTDVDCPSTERCYAATTNKKFLRSIDGGENWHASPSPSLRRYVGALSCGSNPQQCTALTRYVVQILQIADGENWTQTSTSIEGQYIMPGLDCAALDNCVAVGHSAEYPLDGIVLYREPGSEWQSHKPQGIEGSRFFAVDCNLDQECYAVGVGSGVWKSLDRGKTWTKPRQLISQSLLGINCPAKGTCYAVGDQGAGFFTQDGGESWFDFSLGDDVNYKDIECLSESHCIAVGEEGAIRIGTQSR